MMYVYIITDGSFIKIGKSTDPKARVKTLQTANAKILTLEYVFDTKEGISEKKLHKLFAKYKTESRNEWFFVDGKLGNILIGLGIPFAKVKQGRQKAIKLNGVKRTPVLIKDIKDHLANMKHVRISYYFYAQKYGMDVNQVQKTVQDNRMGKYIFQHNAKVKRK